MKTFIEKLEEKRDACVTIEDWKEAYNWLMEEAIELNDEALRMQGAIVEKYGEKALDELIEMALDDDFEPNMTPAMQEMLNYGYTKMEILPVDKETATLFYNKDCAVYMLYPNNTEKKVEHMEDIQTFDGLLGISVPEITEKVASKAGFLLETER